MTTEDLRKFEATIEELHDDFQRNLFQYGTEDPVVAELYRRLSSNIADRTRSIQFKSESGDNWRATEGEQFAASDGGSASRLRVEPTFVHQGTPWEFERETDDGVVSSVKRFDLAILDHNPLVMQSKRRGPGNYWDTDNDISVLCEVKHSKNETLSMIFGGDTGLPAKDLKALSDYPGPVQSRVLVFFDWWSTDADGNARFDEFHEQLRDTGYHTGHSVDVLYVPRTGSLRRIEDI